MGKEIKVVGEPPRNYQKIEGATPYHLISQAFEETWLLSIWLPEPG